MSQDNKNVQDKKSTKKKKTKKRISIFRLIIVIILMVAFVAAGAVGGLVLATVKNAPDIDPTKMAALLNENSEILDKNGNIVEKVQTEEFRTIVDLERIPDHLEDAFIAIEDERFETHIGVDIKRIFGALVADLKAGAPVQGASTITQQLVKNLYLTNEKKIDRKIKEAYLSIQVEKQLTKDQILEAYLNTIYLGQGAYGVQAAAHTYFDKDVEDLTIAESAMIAGATKNPSRYDLYSLVRPENLDKERHHVVGELDIFGEKWIAVFNDEATERQRLVLNQMKKLNFITEDEYNIALNEDMKKAVKPGEKKIEGISSFFTDYVKKEALDALINEAGYPKDEAQRMLYTGGLKIYSTMDVDLQHKIESIYDNFGEILFGDLSKLKTPVLEEWKKGGNLDNAANLIDDNRNVIFYKKENILDPDGRLVLEKGTFSIAENGNLIINNKKFNIYPKTLDIVDYYSIDEKKNLVTHTLGSLDIQDNYTTENVKNTNGNIIINSDFLKNNQEFYTIDDNGNLLISSRYFSNNHTGIVQPQSATVISDYRTGEILALVGGRDIKGSNIFNRATAQRQPGSAIKPIAVYLPALDNGMTVADIIDDIPHYDSKGNRWPKNWYEKREYKYWGLNTLRESVEQSINVASVKVLERIGIDTSIEYLTRMGIISEDNPKKDSFVTRDENPRVNDETLASLGVGGMTHGLTPLEMTAAFGSIANMGVYVEPIAFTKIVDSDGNVIVEKNPQRNSVVTPQVSYLMTDVLESTVTSGLARRAAITPNNAAIPVAGKTGTTQEQGDIWFVGYTPYYATGVWIGNDSPMIKLSEGSSKAAELWRNIMEKAHEGLEPRDFEVPQGYVYKNICIESGKLATELCARDPRGSTVRSELFIKGTEPTEFCDVHVEVEIDTSTGKLANENCPPELIEKKVFIKRDPPYIPEENDGIVPIDYQYTVPTEVCDEHTETESDNFDDWFNWLFESNPDNNNYNNNNNDNNDNSNEDINIPYFNDGDNDED